MDELQKLCLDIAAYDKAAGNSLQSALPRTSNPELRFRKVRLLRLYAELIESSAEIEDLIQQLKKQKSNVPKT